MVTGFLGSAKLYFADASFFADTGGKAEMIEPCRLVVVSRGFDRFHAIFLCLSAVFVSALLAHFATTMRPEGSAPGNVPGAEARPVQKVRAPMKARTSASAFTLSKP